MATDGQVEIKVILDDGSVAKGIANINKEFDGLSKGPEKANVSVLSLVKSFGLLKLGAMAFSTIKGAMDGAISRFDTMQKFPKVMQALGFSADDSKKSINKLGDGIDGLPTKLDDVVSSTQQLTSITGDLDRSTDTVLALNNAFLASGASTDDAARGMQQYNKMVSTGKVELDGWQSLQETMPLALQKTAEAMGFVGKSAQTDLYDALKSGEVTFDQFTDKLIELGTGTGMLADLAKKNSLGIATSFGNLKNSVSKNLGNMLTKIDEIVEKVTGKTIAQNIDSLKVLINSTFTSITNSLDKVTPYLIAFGKWFGANIGTIKQFAAAVGVFIGVFTGLMAVVKSVTGTFKLLNAVLALNPFTLIITAISALVALFIYLWNTNEAFKNAMIAAWQAISSFLIPLITNLVNFIKMIWGALTLWWQENQATIMNAIMTAWNFILTTVVPIVTEVAGFIMAVWNRLFTWFVAIMPQFLEAVTTVWNAISDIVVNVLDFLMPFIEIAWEFIRAITMAVWTAIRMIVTAAITIIQGIIQTVLAVINGDWKTAWEGIKTIASGVWNLIYAIVELAIKAVLAIVISTLKALWAAVKAIFNLIVSAFKAGMDAASNWVKDGIDRIKNFFNALADIDLFEIGSDVIKGFVEGMKSAGRWIKDTISNLVGDVTGWLKSAFKIGSPSRLMRDEIGKWIPPGIAVGVEHSTDKAVDSLETMQKDMMKAIDINKIAGTPTATKISGTNQIIQNIYSEQQQQDNGIPANTVFEIPITIEGDGGVWARGTASYMWAEIQKLQRRVNRNKGVLTT